ncbi:hypothetical protein EX227_14520 [Providencia rettgeri]|uniref:Uncharacterized protein n=1 Tax=Providencia rettgeri TaxID=587 RepID=A0AAP2K2L5_PRORE|nr:MULTISPECIES: hypothetical protein [Providencia]ELR5198597.1 hypothetical protein [Providencia rettgeri]MBX6950077.1 hypothetical protein [Providencia rettgeri]MBX6955662.1 hypothetical protein [Providencia rettgeri]MBX6961082.1 hypothetical protein [Providencia rettgeri]MBX6973862.1 hypothetical protein [Providencia rettgeri]
MKKSHKRHKFTKKQHRADCQNKDSGKLEKRRFRLLNLLKYVSFSLGSIKYAIDIYERLSNIDIEHGGFISTVSKGVFSAEIDLITVVSQLLTFF